MKFWLTLLLLASAPSIVLAQSSTTFISDSAGNQTTATLTAGNLYLFDSKGHSATGTVRNGYIYMNGSKGEYTFGTLRNGNIFLTDQTGNTTGTIRNGYIFLNNGDGSTTTGSYDSLGHVFTTTTPTPEQSLELRESQKQQRQLDQQRQQQATQQNYENGRQIGAAIGNGVVSAHQITNYCNNNPTGEYLGGNGITIQCPQAPITDYENKEATNYCADNPGKWIEFGRHRIDCNIPSNPPNLKWAKWELKEWQWDFRNRAKANLQISSDQIQANWGYWKNTYCRLSPGRAKYEDLGNKKHPCN